MPLITRATLVAALIALSAASPVRNSNPSVVRRQEDAVDVLCDDLLSQGITTLAACQPTATTTAPVEEPTGEEPAEEDPVEEDPAESTVDFCVVSTEHSRAKPYTASLFTNTFARTPTFSLQKGKVFFAILMSDA